MSESSLQQLKILVERAVRPVRASAPRKRKIREELLSHVNAVFEEEMALRADEHRALERTALRFGNPRELTGPLQESVPKIDAIERVVDRVIFRPGESTLNRAIRYTAIIEVVAVLFMLLCAVLLQRRGFMEELPTDGIWQIGMALVAVGYLGFTIGIFESTLRRALIAQNFGSWFRFAVVFTGSNTVSMTLGLMAYGFTWRNVVCLFFFTAGFPVFLARSLSLDFSDRERYYEDWANLPID